MPTYAILGGTGNIGTELIKQLATKPGVRLHVYARSQQRLLKAHPILAEKGSPHHIFTGDLNDVDLLSQCISGAEVVYGVVGTNANKPGLHIAQDLAQVIITALNKLRDGTRHGETFHCPTVVFTTSAGMTSDPRVRANFPAYLHWVIQRVGKYIYEDFRVATAILRRPENAWIPVILFCAPGLASGPSQGPISVGQNIPKNAPKYVTYDDLARGMVQSAQEVDTWAHKEIGIVGAKMPPQEYGLMLYYFSTGLMCVWAPPLWRFGHNRGWWGDK